MKKFMIENVQVGVTEGGMACGPISGNVVAEVCVRDLEANTVAYHSLTEIDSILVFTLSTNSTYEDQIKEDYDDTEFWNKMSTDENGEYSDYKEFYADLESHEHCDEDISLIWKYLAYMVRADWDEVDKMKKLSIGKILGEFEIPVCDAEQKYLEGQEN